MHTDSQFIDNYIAAVQEEHSEDEQDAWVAERMARDFMRNARVTLYSGACVPVITALLLMGHVSPLGLIACTLCCAGALAHRGYTLQQFDLLLAQAASNNRLAQVGPFFRRYAWSWPLSGASFALPVFLYYDHAPISIQYLSLMILVAMGATGSALMSAHLQCQRWFIHALIAVIICAAALSWVQQWPKALGAQSVVFMLLALLFWGVVLYLGRHLNELQTRSYSAQFGNEQLIRSLRQQTQAATEAVLMKNNLLASAAHDLRQPVHALAFYADWLRSEPQLASSVIPKILAATDSVNTLFNSLFDFARIESGAIQVNISEVNIEQLIDEMAVQFAPAADQKGLYLRAQAVPAMVLSDPVLLRRITSNLLANAIRYTEQGGVMISARVMGSKLWIEVSDSGVGIAPEHLPHIFKEFYRAPVHQGTADSFGLGLAIVQRLCRVLGHVMTIRSVRGKGTRGRVEIALDSSQVSDTSEPMPLESTAFLGDQIKPRERAQ